jgi:hypothetical protein
LIENLACLFVHDSILGDCYVPLFLRNSRSFPPTIGAAR